MRRSSFAVREELASRTDARIDGVASRPGARLPSEPELAAELGVSRATLREALRSLEEEGLAHADAGRRAPTSPIGRGCGTTST